MARITFVSASGDERDITASTGSLMQAAVLAGISGIRGDCGGNAACATCHIHVPDAWSDRVGQPDEAELAMLEFEDGYTAQSRLACQIDISEDLNGLRVQVVAAD